MECINCKYWYSKNKKIGTCSLLSSLKGGLKSYVYKNKKLPCEIVYTLPTFGCNNFIKLNDTPNKYEVVYFNDIISNNKSDYIVKVVVLAKDEIEAIKAAAISTDILCKERDSIMKIEGSKHYIIDILMQLGFHFKEVNLKQK